MHSPTYTHAPSPSDKVPVDGSVGGFLRGSFCSSGSSTPPGLRAASQCTPSTSPPTLEAVALQEFNLSFKTNVKQSGIMTPEREKQHSQ